MATNAPCLGCNQRWVNVLDGTRCHSTCTAYLAFQQVKIRENHVAREDKKVPMYITPTGVGRNINPKKKARAKRFLLDSN